MKAFDSEASFSRGVNALRGLAILGIVFFHYHRRLSGVENSFQWYFGPLPSHPQAWGYLGVSLFFILSGWALTNRLGPLAKGKELKGESALGFYRKRFRRILPLYYLSILIFFLGFLLLTQQNVTRLSEQFFLKLVFLQNISPNTIFSYNSSWWFLGTLVFLYAVYPGLLQLFRKGPDLALGFCLVASFLLSHALARPIVASWHPYLAMGGFPFVKLGEFGFGIWLALVGRQSPKKWILVTASLAILGVCGLWHRAFYPLHPLGLVAPLVLAAEWFPALGLAQLGVYSYGLFLFHRPLIDPWLALLRARGVPNSPWLGPMVFMICLLMLTVPLEKMTKHVFRRKKFP